jgi:hypothetical protein
VLRNTEVVALSGSPYSQLERIRWRHRPSGNEAEKPIRHLFLFIGAAPATNWLQGCISLDARVRSNRCKHTHPANAFGQFQGSAVVPSIQRPRRFRRRRRALRLGQTGGRCDRRRRRAGGPTAYLFGRRTSPPCGEVASGPSLMILTRTKNSTRAKGFIRIGTDVAEKILSAMRKCSGGRFEPKALRP